MGGMLFLLLIFSTTFIDCQKKSPAIPVVNKPIFDSIPTAHPLEPLLGEISGIADSKVNPGFLWGEQDSGNSPLIFLIGHDGKVKKPLYIKGATDKDWEDMTLAGDQIYLGDIGDNSLKRETYFFYYFKEPNAETDTVYPVNMIRFKYPDGSHNAEAFLVDKVTHDIFIITKNDKPSLIYKLSAPYNHSQILTAEKVGQLDYTEVVSAAISPDGDELILKTYLGLQYYKRNKGQTISDALMNKSISLPYVIEPQGEAVCFAHDNSGFYTLSEKGFFNFVNLYFYGRN